MQSDAPSRCPRCGSEIAATLRACPACRWLVHSERLTALAAEAERATAAGDPSAALAAWREALGLLPPNAGQAAAIAARVVTLSGQVEALGGTPAARPDWARGGAGMGALGLLIWKLKALLALGLKGGTLLTMLASFGLYWTAFGWAFALGLVLCIYVHEMGHVIAMRSYGMPASAPIFVPGLGAFIRMGQHPSTPREEARIGLAGPMYGLGATLAALALYGLTRSPAVAAIAHVSAWINLFNLLPVWQLDGSRAFVSLSRSQRWLVTAVFGVLAVASGDGLVMLQALLSAGRTLSEPGAAEPDGGACGRFVLLQVALGAMLFLHVPLPG